MIVSRARSGHTCFQSGLWLGVGAGPFGFGLHLHRHGGRLLLGPRHLTWRWAAPVRSALAPSEVVRQ